MSATNPETPFSDPSAMCEAKYRYADKRNALTAINAFSHQRGRHGRPEALRAYPCPHCGGWHLTKRGAVKLKHAKH